MDSQVEQIELKPCPFCGGTPYPRTQNGLIELSNRAWRQHVWCLDCDVTGPERDTSAQAIEAWNTRASLALPKVESETIERLKKSLVKAQRERGDALYMIQALVPMLGEKGRQVWDLWRKAGALRVHFSWGPEGASTRGEDRAQLHLEIEQATEGAEMVENIDGDLPQAPYDAPFNTGGTHG